ncbi:hypothetical protein CCP4SC76_3540004 [Gammaproteobacteria bacterium]
MGGENRGIFGLVGLGVKAAGGERANELPYGDNFKSIRDI